MMIVREIRRSSANDVVDQCVYKGDTDERHP